MPGRVEGKVAFITGAARGQGRSHAVRLAEEGADIIAVDACAPIQSVEYEMASRGDLAETASLVEALGRRIVTAEADVRDYEALSTALEEGSAELGGLDIVVANAGILSYGLGHELTEEQWDDLLDINLKGVWHTVKAAVPALTAQESGSIIVTSSAAGLYGPPGLVHYVAAKHGLIGLTKGFANELSPAMVRINAICPTQVETPMLMHEGIFKLFLPDEAEPTAEKFAEVSARINLQPIPFLQPSDVSNLVLFLASDESRYVTGSAYAIDAGCTIKVPVGG